MSFKSFRRIFAPGLLGLGLLAVVLLATLGGDSNASANNGVRGLDRAIAAQEAHTDALLAKAGVVGTGVGLGADGQAVVLVLTEDSSVDGVPTDLDGVPTVTQLTGTITALHHRPGHDKGGGEVSTPTPVPDPGPARPDAPIGVGASTGTERLINTPAGFFCTVGTLAGPVTNGTSTWALSNAHVYALQGSNSVGKVKTGPDGDRVLHPGRVDLSAGCGTSTEIDNAELGRLADFEKIRLGGRRSNTIDAAISLVPTGNLTTQFADDRFNSNLHGNVSSTTQAATIGLAVEKQGRTTGLTTGTVTGINVTVLVGYDKGVAKFVNQVMIGGGTFSAGGDSGSLIVTQASSQPVALLFAGGETATFANPIDAVLNHFGVTFGTP